MRVRYFVWIGIAVAAVFAWGAAHTSWSLAQQTKKHGAPTDKKQPLGREKPNDSQEFLESTWWFGGVGPPDLPPLERNLHLDETHKILCSANILVDKRRMDLVDRRDALEALQMYHHQYSLPAVLAVAHDEADKRSLRIQCVITLATFPAKDVADDLFVLVDDEDVRVASFANEALYHVTDRDFDKSDLKLSSKNRERQQAVEAWRRWLTDHNMLSEN